MVRKVGMGRVESNRWEDYLGPDEKLLWQGAPATGIKLSGNSLVLSVFGVFFLGFALFWMGMAASMGTGSVVDIFFPLFGLPFVLVGLWLVAGHLFFDAYKRKHARYALTSRRAIIARSMMGRKMLSYEITPQSEISLIEGDLDSVYFARRNYRTRNGARTALIGFRYIGDGRKVFQMLQDIKNGKYSD